MKALEKVGRLLDALTLAGAWAGVFGFSLTKNYEAATLFAVIAMGTRIAVSTEDRIGTTEDRIGTTEDRIGTIVVRGPRDD